MTLKQDLLQSPKLDAVLRSQIARLPDDTDSDKEIFSIFLRTTDNANIPGATTPTGTVRTAHNVSLNKLKELVENKDVFYMSGGTPMCPENGSRGPRFT